MQHQSISGKTEVWTLPQIGYLVSYHAHAPNHCPACGKQHWIVGRIMAECAFCQTALPLENLRIVGYSTGFNLIPED